MHAGHRTRTAAVAALLAALTWLAWFSRSGAFGLYEDEYAWVPAAMELTPAELGARIPETAFGPNSLGRPLHITAVALLSFAGARIGGLDGAYALAALIVGANTVLFYLLVLRTWRDRATAVAAGIAFALFPADTTRALLQHAFGVQPALLFALVAFHLYVSGRRRSSYVAAAMSLLTYETFFPVLAVAPWLRTERPQRREVATHIGVLATMLGIVAAARFLSGEGRVAGVGLRELAFAALNPAIGPPACLGLFGYRALTGLRDLGGLGAAALLVPLAALAIGALLASAIGPGDSEAGRCIVVDTNEVRLELSARLRRLGGIAATGGAMLVLGYVLTLTTPALAFAGRATRVHAAAAPGASILIAALAAVGLHLARGRRARRLTILGLAAFGGLLLAAALEIQHDYAASWSNQQSFWRQVDSLCPDVGEGTVVLAETVGLPGARPTGEWEVAALLAVPQIRTFSWSLPLVMPLLREAPSGWSRPPRLYAVVPGWRDLVRVESGRPVLSRPWVTWISTTEQGRTLSDGNVILLEQREGRLVRRTGSVEMGGALLRLRDPAPSPGPPRRPRLLYRLLVEGLRR